MHGYRNLHGGGLSMGYLGDIKQAFFPWRFPQSKLRFVSFIVVRIESGAYYLINSYFNIIWELWWIGW